MGLRSRERRIAVDRSKCSGCGQCRQVAPDLFGRDDDGYATLQSPSTGVNTVDGAVEAWLLCPRRAITVEGH